MVISKSQLLKTPQKTIVSASALFTTTLTTILCISLKIELRTAVFPKVSSSRDTRFLFLDKNPRCTHGET